MTVRKKTPPTPDVLLRRPEAMAFVGLGATQFEEKVRKGEIPAPIKISDSGRAVAWLKSELQAWLVERIRKRDVERAAREAAKAETA
jgi:predicted DNA-binding transcriptional regulator AlpA